MESSTTKLSDSEHAALIEPLMDEYHAWNVYSQVMHDFGPVRPFSRIRESEARHAEALQNLLRKYGHPIPPNHPIEPIPRFNTLREACAPLATSNSPTFGRANSPGQDGLIINHQCLRAQGVRPLP